MDFSTLRLGGRSACPVPVSLVRAPVRERFRMSVTCPLTQTRRPSRPFNQSFTILQWYGTNDDRKNRSPFILHFRPGEHVPRHLARKGQIKFVHPLQARPDHGAGLQADPERQQKRNGGKSRRSPFVRSVRSLYERATPAVPTSRPVRT